MQKYIVTLFAFILVNLSLSVTAETRENKITRLIKAQGFEDILHAQMQVRISEQERIGQEIMYAILDNLVVSSEVRMSFEEAHKKYLNKVIKPWSVSEITQVWSDLYGVHFTDQELDGLLVFYESDLAQRETEVIKTAAPQYTRHFQDLAKAVFRHAIEEYRIELMAIAQQCDCQKDA